MTEPIAAAYGWRVPAADGDPWLALHGAEDWPDLEIDWSGERAPAGAAARTVTAELADGKAVARFPDPAGGLLAHPLLGTAALRLAGVRGQLAVHGGAIRGRAGAWLVIGPKEGGKSSLLATASLAGADILCDDVAVVDEGRLLAGPRLVDLRAPAARALEADTTPVRDDERFRLHLAPTEAEAVVAGVVHLAWGARIGIRRLSPAERLMLLAAAPIADLWLVEPTWHLDLSSLPTLHLTRPQRWSEAHGAALELLDAIEAR
ncbi:MAG: hypothetical protein ACRDL2_09635 [Gaiellaceae bacterium]